MNVLKLIIDSSEYDCGLVKTPFLEYHVLEQLGNQAARSARGYDDSIGLWEKLNQIREIADRVGIRDRKVRKDILAAGPCPGLWRIYYAATANMQKDEPVGATEYLGNQINLGISRRELGMKFDEWIAEANRYYNDFLETGDLACLKKIPGNIGQYYRKRADKHYQMADHARRARTRLMIKPDIKVPEGLPLYGLNPDGIFLHGVRAAVFEAKLSHPRYREFPHEMAVYAITYERTHQKDTDYAIVLYSDYPVGRNLFTFTEPILDSYVNEINSNIERFLHLVQLSERSARASVAARFRTKIRPGYDSWKRFLRRPPQLPNQNQRRWCPSCRYRPRCHPEGGEA